MTRDGNCEVCGEFFHAWHRQKYCGVQCKYEAFKARRNKGQPDPRVRSLAGKIGHAMRRGHDFEVESLRRELKELRAELARQERQANK